jgi:protein SCO1/2
MKQRVPVFYLLILVLALVVIWVSPTLKSPAGTSGSESLQGEAAIGGHFNLTDQHGKKVSDADFRGKAMLVFFGFTHCPDICPVASSRLNAMMQNLGADADKAVPVFITVDPARDNPSVLKNYFANFDKRFVALTGSDKQVKDAAAAYKVYYNAPSKGHGEAHGAHHEHGDGHAPSHGGDYNVDHSGFIYLMDKNGRYVRHFNYDASSEEMAAAVREVL